MLHVLSLAIPVLLIVIGLIWAVHVVAQPRVRPGQLLVAGQVVARGRLRLQADELGLAHRLGARILRSRYRARDVEFQLVADYTEHVDTRAIAMLTPYVFWTAADIGRPLLELERLLEWLEKFTRRVTTWRPGRKRGQS